MIVFLVLGALAWPHPAWAHGAEPELGAGWTWEAWILGPLAVSALWFAAGQARLWWRAGTGAGVSLWRASAWWLGWALLVVALVSPLHRLGEGLFWAHMTEHEILMACAAPLLVLGQPGVIGLWALPRTWRPAAGSVGVGIARSGIWRGLAAPAPATILHGAAIWLWHLPGLFNAALRSEGLHALQHASFLVTALMFWWALLHPARRGASYGRAVLYLFITAVHTSLLGALLVVSQRLWYQGQNRLAETWNIAPLSDQQLGGLIMWVPGGMIYALAALILLGLWLAKPGGAFPRRAAAR